MLDEILNEMLGIHILEPIISYEEKLRVRPKVQNQFKPKAEALNYMKKVEKKVKPIVKSDQANMNAAQKRTHDQEIKPKLSVELKIEVASFPLKERPHAQDTAEVLEEILQAVSKGLDKLPPRISRMPGHFINEAKIKRKEEQEKEKEIKDQKEAKRVKRYKEIKGTVAQQQEDKKTAMEEARKERKQKAK